MYRDSVMNAGFDLRRHLEDCLKLPARSPEPFYRPDKRHRTRYFDESIVLNEHSGEVERLRSVGVPFYLAEALVVTAYAHTQPTLQRRVKEAAKL